MNLKQLQHFVALAEAGNVHRASARLNLSQPALSKSIRFWSVRGRRQSELFYTEPPGWLTLLRPLRRTVLRQWRSFQFPCRVYNRRPRQC